MAEYTLQPKLVNGKTLKVGDVFEYNNGVKIGKILLKEYTSYGVDAGQVPYYKRWRAEKYGDPTHSDIFVMVSCKSADLWGHRLYGNVMTIGEQQLVFCKVEDWLDYIKQ